MNNYQSEKRKSAVMGRRQMIKMGVGAAIGLSGCELLSEPAEGQSFPLGRALPFDRGWRFFRGEGEGFEIAGLDDSLWRQLDLPHDWSVEDAPNQSSPDTLGPFVKSAGAGTETGFTLGGEGWYRKVFLLPKLPAQGKVEIQFEGVSVTSDVWVNGHHAGSHKHGYTAFSYDISRYLEYGGRNQITVRVRNFGHNSRWYAGSGIYRAVTLNVLPSATQIDSHGVAAWTREVSESRAEVDVTTTLVNIGPGMTLSTRLLDLQGKVVAEAVGPALADTRQVLIVSEPKLWSPDAPHLYHLETLLQDDGQIVDRLRQVFGLRIVRFDAEQGLTINGVRTPLRGGCIHHDNGLLGAAAYPDAEERKVLLLKARGFNAIRSAHNPSSKALLNACDRHGMLLVEESFDMWHAEKLADDYSNFFDQSWQKDMQAMVLAGRNHPSVIMWSIGNEIPQRSTSTGVKWSWHLANEVRRLDPSRPVTAGINGSPGRPLIAAEGTARRGEAGKPDYASSIFLDVIGYNYKLHDFERDHAVRPDRVFYGSETYPKEAYDYTVLAEKAPYMIGEFVWTAMDYLGEAGLGLAYRFAANSGFPGAHGFPVVGAYCGDIDLIGEQKPQSLARDVIWGLSPLEVTVARPLPEGMIEYPPAWGWPEELSGWTWPGQEGKTVKVRVYTSADHIELLINGRLAGERRLAVADKMYAEIEVAYVPGKLEVVAYQQGRESGRRYLQTADVPSRLEVIAEQLAGKAVQGSLCYARIDVQDERGVRVPDASQTIRVAVSGPAELIGFGSANPRAVGSLQSSIAQTYQGKALLVLRSTGRSGDIDIKVSGEGLKPGRATVRMT